MKEQSFHIIFMDHMMPEMDGVETLHEIHKLKGSPNEKTPVIALTANAISGAREYYMKEGFADFFTKPIDSAKLEQMIAALLPEELVHRKETKGRESGTDNYDRYQQYGISIEQGLSNVADNKELYLRVVEIFIRDGEKPAQLKQFITDGNAHDYGVHVHALKGDAKILGADSLVDLAYNHEEQSMDGNLAYVEEHWDELVECWERARDGFEEFYRENGGE